MLNSNGQRKERHKNMVGDERTEKREEEKAGNSRKPSRRGRVLEGLALGGTAPGFVPEEPVHKADDPGVIWVDIDRIHESPFQHEEQIDPDAFAALVSSIASEGLWQAFNVMEDLEHPGDYILTSGMHQRRKAAKAAGLTRVPIFVGPQLDRKRLAYRAAKENTTDVNRSRVNQGYLFIQMGEEFGATQEEIATEIKKSRDYVKYCIMAANSPQDIQIIVFETGSVRAMTYLRRIKADIALEEEETITPEEQEKREAEATALRAPIIEKFRNNELSTDGVEVEVEKVLAWREAQKQPQQSDGEQQTNDATTMFSDPAHDATIPGSSSLEVPLAQETEDHRNSNEDTSLGTFLASTAISPVPNTEQELAASSVHSVHSNASEQSFFEETKPHLTIVSPVVPVSTERREDARASERLAQARAALSRLQTYKRMVGTDSLAEDERQVIEEIKMVVTQLLKDNRNDF